MTYDDKKKSFEKEGKIYESTKLKFSGVGYTVYNCSIPFYYKGKTYIYGRVEKFDEWMRSWVMMFMQTGKDEYTLVKDSMIYQLEDPYISIIDNKIIMGGTHVKLKSTKLDTYYGYFYEQKQGNDIFDLHYFTSGPDRMKDIRLVQMKNKIGVFSRPAYTEQIKAKYGSDAVVGFAIINNLYELNDDVIKNAEIIPDMFGEGEWGGANQCYYLDTGLIGIIAHKSYRYVDEDDIMQACYTNVAYIMDPEKRKILDEKIIATRGSYPDGPVKKPNLKDCVFTSGIVMREDGKADLYSGISDCEEGRVVIDYPFEGYGNIVEYSLD